MHNGIILQNDRFKKVIASKDVSGYKIVKDGQLVIAFPIDEGLIYTQDVVPEGIMSPAYNVWNVDYSKVNRRFLVSYFHSKAAMDYYKEKLRGTTQRRRMLDKEDLLTLPIPLPPLPEQESIVKELDLLSGIIEKKKQQLKELDNLAQSIFYEMFGDNDVFERWNSSTLLDVCLNIVDCPHTTPKKEMVKTAFPCIRTSELKGGTIHWDTMQYISEEEYEKRITRLKPKTGDIVYGREGSFGDAVILPDGYNFSLGQRTMLFRANEDYVDNVFLHRVLISNIVYRQALDNNVSSTVAHINVKDIKRFRIPVPPLSLQQSFAQKIEAIEKQKTLINQSIKETETLFNSRMDYYFN